MLEEELMREEAKRHDEEDTTGNEEVEEEEEDLVAMEMSKEFGDETQVIFNFTIFKQRMHGKSGHLRTTFNFCAKCVQGKSKYVREYM